MRISDLINMYVEKRIKNINVSLPAKVVEYDSSLRKAKVEIMVDKEFEDSEDFDYPIISGVPLIHPSAGGATINFPVNKGDYVLLVFSDLAIDDFMYSNEKQRTKDLRNHDLNDAVGIIGLQNFTNSNNFDENSLTFSYKNAILKMNTEFNFEGDVVFENNVTFKGNVQFDNGFTSTGGADMSGGIDISGTVAITGSLTVNGVPVT
jgi:hypothetical protein